jgi:uncharacterized repeat protein (TIGR02543 family)
LESLFPPPPPPPTYIVTYNGNANIDGTAPVDGSSPYTAGSNVIVLGNTGNLTKTNNTFSGWNTQEDGYGVSYLSGSSFTMPNSNITLFAKWTLTTYKVIYNKNASAATGSITDASSYMPGDKVSVKSDMGLTNIGNTFVSWNTKGDGNGTPYSSGDTFPITANITLYAQWNVNSYTLTYHQNAVTASGNPPSSQTHNYGASINIEGNTGNLSKTGHAFTAWNTLVSGLGTSYSFNAPFTMPAQDTTLYADWKQTFKLTYDKNANTATGQVPQDDLSYIAGTAATILQNPSQTPLSNTGYTFAGWTDNSSGTGRIYNNPDKFTITPNATLYAKWNINNYSVTYYKNADDATGNPPSLQTANYNTILPIQGTGTLSRPGYVFTTWNALENGTGTSYPIGQQFTIPATNTKLYAQWTPTYTMSYNNNSVAYPNATGTITDSLSPYIKDANVSVKSDAGFTNTGYSFVSWNTSANNSGTSYSPNATFPITATTTLYAQWSVNSYSVTYYKNADDATGNPPSLQTAEYNTIVPIQGTGTLSRTDYAFTAWNTQVDGNGTSYAIGQQFTMPAQDTKLYAQWTPTYTMTYSNNNSVTYPNATGTITDSLSPHIAGSNVSVKSDAGFSNTNYAFNGWNTAANNSETSYTIGQIFPITANTKLYAQWIPTYTISYYGNTPTTGTAPTDNTLYKEGSNVTILGNTGTLTKSGSKFTGWNTQANGLGTTYLPPTTFPITANTSLYAKWTTAYAFSYNGYNSTSGTAPTDNLSPYIAGDEVIILGNTGNLSRTGYNFTGWNTSNGGTGTTYLPGDTYIMLSIGETLFAKWTLSYAFSYNTNGATNGTLPTTATSYIAGEQVIILENTGNLTKSNGIFGGWNRRADGTGANYLPPTTFTMIAQVVTLYVNWIPTYAFKYDSNGATTGTLPTTETFSYLAGQQVTVLDNTGTLTKPNFEFNGWNAQPNGLGTTIYTIGQDFSMPAATLTLYAKWRAIYTFRYDTNGATTGTLPINPTTGTPLVETVYYRAGEDVSVLENTGNLAIPLAIPGTTSYIFNGWNTANNGGGATYFPPTEPTKFAINAHTILYVRWKALYTITYDGNNNTSGTIPIDELSPYAANSQVTTLENTGNLSKTGYTFEGWNLANNGGGTTYIPPVKFNMPANNRKLYAKWYAIFYTLTYSKNTIDATTGTPPTDTTQYIYENPVTIRGNTGNLSRTGYTFTAWNTLENGTGTSYSFNDATFTMPASNTTLYAQWTLINYTVTYDKKDANATGNVIDTSTYTYGNPVTFKLDTGLTNTGYTFAGWTFNSNGTGTLYNNPDTFLINANTTLYAKWIVNSYTLTYDKNAVDAAGTSPAFQTANYNTIVSVQGTGTLSRPSYALINWNTEVNGTGISYSFNSPFTMPAQNAILYAQWSDTTYTLTYDKNANTATGQVPVDNSSYLTNYLVSILQNPSVNPLLNTGYTFVGWTFNSNGTGTLYTTGNTFPIPANTTLYAKWIINNYTLTYAKNANDATGTPPSDTTQYNYNSLVLVQGTNNLSRTNFTFAGWNTVADITTGLGTLYTTGNTFSMPAANTTLYAQWTAYPTLYYDENGGTGGSFPPTTQYAPGTTTSIIATPPTKINYTFQGWNTDAQNGTGIYYANGSSSITIYNESITLYAQWYFNGTTPRYQVAYAAGTGASGTSPNPVTNIREYQLVTASNSLGTLSNPGLTFFGWNTIQNGTGNYYGVGATNVVATPVFNMPSVNLLLSAQWIDTNKPYKLTYDGNQNTGGAVPVGQLTYYSGATAALLNNNGSLVKTGCSFVGWNTAADGTGIGYPFNTPYQKYTPIVMTSHTTLFAKWVAGNLFKNSGSYEGIYTDVNDVTSLFYTSSVTSYRDPTNNTFTIIIPTYYNRYYGGPYGTGNGPDINGIGKLLSTYAQATISQITSGPNLGSYQIVATYITKGTTGTQTQTATLLLESTYWPTTETIASVTMPTTALQPTQFNFNLSPSVVVPNGGYYNQLVRPGSVNKVQCAAVQAFYINFNNNKTTRVAFGNNPYIDTDPSYSFISNYARIEVANGTTPNPITGTFSPSVSTGVNTAYIIQ